MPRIPAAIPLALLCAGLLSCAPLGGRADADTDLVAPAVQAYRAGRSHHLAQRFEQAHAAYSRALEADPRQLDARNGLATLHAEQGELAPAIAIWRELTAPLGRDAGPDRAYLFGNLGHALHLAGDQDGARKALEQACLLDPLHARSWQMLGQVLAALGDEERSRQMLKQAAALRQHDLRADFAVAGGASAVAAIGQALETKAVRKHEREREFDQAWIHAGADGMLELRRSSAAPASTTARLEIRNGNGVTGMARALARRIDEPDLRVTYLSNEPGFAVRTTRIEYEPAHLEQARRLAQRLGSAQLTEAAPGARADLRLVLGRDLARHGTALRLAPLPAAAAPLLSAL